MFSPPKFVGFGPPRCLPGRLSLRPGRGHGAAVFVVLLEGPCPLPHLVLHVKRPAT